MEGTLGVRDHRITLFKPAQNDLLFTIIRRKLAEWVSGAQAQVWGSGGEREGQRWREQGGPHQYPHTVGRPGLNHPESQGEAAQSRGWRTSPGLASALEPGLRAVQNKDNLRS